MVQIMQEGEAFNKWADNRFKRNKNLLLGVTGSTGSGKSYTSLRICELWYEFKFDKPFPVETHVCFSIGELMKLISKGKLKKGEMIILEEAGTSLNSLDYQNKVSKLFSFILQSFRSMNIGLLFTLPVLTMLNKSARLLIHGHFVTCGIDYYLKVCKIKPLFHQLNQERGKSYWKYMRTRVNGNIVTMQRFNYHLPSKELIIIYEAKKKKFVYDLAEEFSKHLDEVEHEHQRKMSRENLTEPQQEVFEDVIELGLTPTQCAEKRKKTKGGVYDQLKRIKRKGFPIEKWIRYREAKSPKRIKAETQKIQTNK